MAHLGRRLAVCSVLVVLVFGALAFRVAQLQLLSGDRYRAASIGQTLNTVDVPAQRGTIFDRDGRDLAMSIQLTGVYVNPKEVVDPVVYASELAPLLGVNETYLEKQLDAKKYGFRYLAHLVSDTAIAKVRKLNLVGIGYLPEALREYPAGALARSVVGVFGGDAKSFGRTGLEALYESTLEGRAGKVVVEQDRQGQNLPNTADREVEARRGSDIVLSLDEPLQWQAEQSLIDEVTATNARGGMAAVVDVTNGDVLAMASVDGATPHSPVRVSTANEQPAPLMDLFEPGSTNKLITLSTAIENGLVTPDTQIDVPPSLQVGNAKFTDVDTHGDVKMSVADILRQSSNIGTIEIAQRMSKYKLADALREFGLGSPTSVEFPDQPAGLLLSPSHYYDTGLASTAIGYGVAVTGMQMLDAYVTIANGGVSRPPHLLDAEIDANGVRHAANVPNGHRVVSARTAQEMTSMLTGVVSGGTGGCAAIPGYTVSGKTGTARKAENGGYSAGTMASFIGYAPAAHPRLAAIVVLDQPSTEYGGTAAAPVFADIMQFALTRDEVAPDDIGNTQYNAAQQAAAASGSPCTDPAVAAARVEALASAAAAATTTTTPGTLSAAGSTGLVGSTGVFGPTGVAGSTGLFGNAGPSGGSGSSGSTGTSGVSGTTGTLPGDTSQRR